MDRADEKRIWANGRWPRAIHTDDTWPDGRRGAAPPRREDDDEGRLGERALPPERPARLHLADDRPGERGRWEHDHDFRRAETFRMRPFRDEPPAHDAPGGPHRTSGPPPAQRGEGRAPHPPPEARRGGWWHREPLLASEIMTTEVKVASRGTPLSEIAALMRSESVGMLPVVDGDGRLLGLVTDRDLVVRGFASGRPVDALKAEDVMSDELVAVAPEDPIRGVLEMMGRRQVRRVPVVDEADRLVGIVSIADIASRADYDHELQDAFERISARRSFWSRLWL